MIASERGLLPRQRALEITRGTLHTLLHHASHHRGFFAHFLDINDAQRRGKCEYSTIDTALCLNGVITAAAYFQDDGDPRAGSRTAGAGGLGLHRFRDAMVRRCCAWPTTRIKAAITSAAQPDFISQWDMAAEQKMMYLQAAGQIEPDLARRLYAGFSRDTGNSDGPARLSSCPAGALFAYQFSEAWLDTAQLSGSRWASTGSTTRGWRHWRTADFCMEHAGDFKTYHANSWGVKCGRQPVGVRVATAARRRCTNPAHAAPYPFPGRWRGCRSSPNLSPGDDRLSVPRTSANVGQVSAFSTPTTSVSIRRGTAARSTASTKAVR